MASLDNGMQQMNVDATWQMIVKGVVLVGAVLLDRVLQRRLQA